MININHKLYPTEKQKQYLSSCLWSAIAVENWVINQIKYELDPTSDRYFPYKYMKFDQLRSILSKKIKGHSKIAGIPSKLINDCIDAILVTLTKTKNIFKVKYKSARTKKSFYFTGDIKIDRDDWLNLPGLKTSIRMSEQGKFQGKLKKVTLMKKFTGWYASCIYDEDRQPIECKSNILVGIDPGSKTALTLSNEVKYNFPKFYQEGEALISKAQRKSKGSKKVKLLHRHIFNKRKDHHHKLSTQLAKIYQKIYWSNDNFKYMVKVLGRSYSNLGLGSFRDLLKNKLASRIDGLGKLVLVGNRNSTRTCCSCGHLTGPKGWDEAKVREWECSECGFMHDRDVNAARNTLFLGEGGTYVLA